ncbi:MAG: AAA family ATPase, partial [Acidimicrobiales bacterium]
MPRAQLLELSAHGVGVIDDAVVEFGPGFNVITGETGAGKTLLLGALDLCLGGEGALARSSAGSDTRAAAVFRRPDGVETVLSRAAGGQGRLRSAVDGAASSAEALRVLAAGLVVVNGQHESLALRQRGDVRALLDASAGISTTELADTRRSLAEARRQRDSLGGDATARLREGEFVAFQIAEIEATKVLDPDELTESLLELTRLTELRDGHAALVAGLDELDGDADDAVLA